MLQSSDSRFSRSRYCRLIDEAKGLGRLSKSELVEIYDRFSQSQDRISSYLNASMTVTLSIQVDNYMYEIKDAERFQRNIRSAFPTEFGTQTMWDPREVELVITCRCQDIASTYSLTAQVCTEEQLVRAVTRTTSQVIEVITRAPKN